MVFSVLRTRNFRNYFFSDIISGFGVGMSTIGANWFIMDRTGSLSAVGLMLTLNVLGQFCNLPFVWHCDGQIQSEIHYSRNQLEPGDTFVAHCLCFALFRVLT